jgi:transglutaminase-like putative cysteine protease
MRLEIRHETLYEYAEPAFDSHNEVRLQPLEDDLQRCESFELAVDPPAQVRCRADYFGNTVHYFSVAGYHRRLAIRAEAIVVTEKPPADGPPRNGVVPLSHLEQPGVREPLVEYLTASHYVPLTDELRRVAAERVDEAGGDGARFWDALIQYFRANLTYEPGSSNVEDDAAKVLRQRRGVCQDFAHLTIAFARAAGVPARYVSGYVQPSYGIAEASHAWAELYLPGPGWVGLDTSGPGPIDERYVRVAYGRDYADANPVRGTFRGGGRQDLSVAVSVEQVQQQ